MNIPADEPTLISRLKNGSKTAFDTIYYRYVGQLMAFCQSYLHVVEDSEEVVEDVFISLWNNRDNLRNSSSLRPFLFTAAKNRLLSVLRKRVNSSIYEEYVAARHDCPGEDTPMEYAEFERMVMQCIRRLPSTQRKVLEMSRFENMSNAEIAKALNLSIQTVKNSLSLALRSLHQKIKAFHGPIITIISIVLRHYGS